MTTDYKLEEHTPAQGWRLMHPYGKWTCADGREVLFNRSYYPILQRYPGGPVSAADPNEWVDFERQEFFWDGWTHHADVLKTTNRILAAWGLPKLGPKPAETRSSEPIEVWTLGDSVPRRRNPWADQIG
jgi:hypothetical protein